MDTPTHQTGVMRVNGEWVTSVSYEARVYGPEAGMLDLKFLKGRDLIARATLGETQATALLGESNMARIRRSIATDADHYLASVKGTLRGTTLAFRDLRLPSPTEANSVEALVRPASSGPPTAASVKDAESSSAQYPQPKDRPSGGERAPDDRNPVAVPPHIAAKYLERGAHYHFDDQTLAFIDFGSRLTASTENTAVIQDLIAIAQARGWDGIRVRGTDSFRQAVWRTASAAGLSVVGYTPSAIELAAADRARGPERRAAAPTPTSADTRAAPPAFGDPSKVVVYGTLLSHGPAPYRHDPTQPSSYYVTLKDPSGQERTLWGAGLKEALCNARTAPAAGDEVGLRRTGSVPVAVNATHVDENGELKNARAERQRALWVIEKSTFFTRAAPQATPADLHAMGATNMDTKSTEGERPVLTRTQEAAAAIRSAQITREELQLKYPELNKAVFQHFSAQEQFADAYVKAGLIRESDRQQVIAQMRERLAGKIERGEVLREPDDARVRTLIRRSVNRVAADIGRPAVQIEPRSLDPGLDRVAREEAQVRL